MKLPAATFLAALLAFGALCASPHLSAVQAVQLADADVGANHYDLRNFLTRKATFSNRDNSWHIRYQQKKSSIAFEVRLDDQSRRMETTFICSGPPNIEPKD